MCSKHRGLSRGTIGSTLQPTAEEGVIPKLQTSWDGPYKITKRLNDVVCRIQKVNSPRIKIKVVHKEGLVKYGNRDNEPIRDEQS